MEIQVLARRKRQSDPIAARHTHARSIAHGLRDQRQGRLEIWFSLHAKKSLVSQARHRFTIV